MREDAVFPELLRQLIGMRVKEVVLRAGSFVIIDLVDAADRPARLIDDAVLWIYMAGWRLDVAGRPVAGHEDAHPDMSAAASSIVGGVLTDVEEDADHLDVVFHFGDVSIKVFPMEFVPDPDDPDDSVHWAAWLPSGQVLVAGPGTGRGVEEAERSLLTAQLVYVRDHEYRPVNG